MSPLALPAQPLSSPPAVARLAAPLAYASAVLFGRRPVLGTEPGGETHFKQHDWNALVQRFVRQGEVDYTQFKRVRRILEAYLQRVADARPAEWANRSEQVAFYLNAFNAIMIHQILVHGPLSSVREIRAAFVRPYPVGRRNMSLAELEVGTVRAFRDPRAQIALVYGARGSALLPSYAYTGPELEAQLAAVTAGFLRDEQRGMRYDAATHTLFLSPVLRRSAGAWARPDAAPSPATLVYGLVRPRIALPGLQDWLPEALRHQFSSRPRGDVRITTLPFDWRLNGSFEPSPAR